MRRFFALALAMGAAGFATAGHAASAQGSATVSILKAVTVSKTSDLNFGKVAAGSAAGTVGIAIDGTRTCGASLTCLGTGAAGAFDVVGTAGETVSVSLDSTSVVLTDSTQDTMTVTLASSAKQLTLAAGKASFKVGGTLAVAAQQPAGVYTGLFQVSVNYE